MKELKFYSCNGLACVSLKDYNDALEEIERLNIIIDELEKFIIIESSTLGLIGKDKLLDKLKELKEN